MWVKETYALRFHKAVTQLSNKNPYDILTYQPMYIKKMFKTQLGGTCVYVNHCLSQFKVKQRIKQLSLPQLLASSCG